MGDELNITCAIDGDKAVYTLEGSLTLISSPYLEEEFAKLGDGIASIDIDATDLDHISDDGFELLVSMQEELENKGGALRILHPDELIAEIVEMMELPIEIVE